MLNRLNPDFLNMLYRVPVLLLSFMAHELSHAFVAYRYGDMTAKNAGRISFNPLRHIDPVGAIMLIVVGFGWAKPVPINPNNFRNRKAGIAFTSLAGPLSNIVIALIFYCARGVFMYKARPAAFIPFTDTQTVILNIMVQFIIVNVSLAAFNLIPIPPLDGSKVLFSFLPEHILYNYVYKYERYGMIILVALSFTRVLNMILGPIINALIHFFEIAADPIINFLVSL